MERRGATQCILFVDHGYDQRDPAIALYRSEGFVVVDHLWSYWRGRSHPMRDPEVVELCDRVVRLVDGRPAEPAPPATDEGGGPVA
jgi:hypothetical protein